MLKVGITGGIGSGKSVVCQVFERLGISIFYADSVAKQLLNTNSALHDKLIDLFGKDIYTPELTIHRKKLAEIIFNNKLALQQVNNLVHPLVRDEFNRWTMQQRCPYVIQEAAILFESQQTHLFDKIITVTAPIDLKIKRIIKRDNVSAENVLERMKNQMDDDFKIANSDYVIDNDGIKMLIPQIIKIHNKLV